jgi:hypothetical protein
VVVAAATVVVGEMLTVPKGALAKDAFSHPTDKPLGPAVLEAGILPSGDAGLMGMNRTRNHSHFCRVLCF